MATVTTTLAPNLSTDAGFQAVVTAVHTRITGFGWVQTADTGQINPATVTRPGGTNVASGYLFYRMADALQATAPVYLKLEVGTGAGTQMFGIWVQVGSGSDGAGALTGVISDRIQYATSANGTTTPFDCRFSGDTDRFAMCLWRDDTTTLRTLVFGIERSKGATKANTGSGVIIQGGHGGSTSATGAFFKQQYLDRTSGPGNVDNILVSACPTGATGGYGTTVGVYPTIPLAGVAQEPGLNFGIYLTGDIAAGSTQAITVAGTAHSYLILGDNLPWASWTTSTRLAMRWE